MKDGDDILVRARFGADVGNGRVLIDCGDSSAVVEFVDIIPIHVDDGGIKMNATRALAEAWQTTFASAPGYSMALPSILWDELKARGFDITPVRKPFNMTIIEAINLSSGLSLGTKASAAFYGRLHETGFDIVAMPSVEDHTAGFGKVEVNQKPTYNELVDVLENIYIAFGMGWELDGVIGAGVKLLDRLK